MTQQFLALDFIDINFYTSIFYFFFFFLLFMNILHLPYCFLHMVLSLSQG